MNTFATITKIELKKLFQRKEYTSVKISLIVYFHNKT